MKHKLNVRFIKYILLVSISISFFNGYSKDYPMPAPQSFWGFVDDLGGYSLQYTFSDTTMPNSKKYTLWTSLNKNDGKHFTRNDSNKVYIYDTATTKEVILYDFNLTKNDTFTCRYPFYATESKFVVVSDTLVTMKNGQQRKRLELNQIDTNILLSNRTYYTWVEGIGDLFFGFFYSQYSGVVLETEGLVCYCDSSGTVYQMSSDINCDNVVSSPIIEHPKVNVIISRNDMLSVQSDINVVNLSIYTLLGQKILESNQMPVQLPKVTTGIYIVRILLNNGESFSKEISIRH